MRHLAFRDAGLSVTQHKARRHRRPPYLAALIPTAPVPFGGALPYVPMSWVRLADIGGETLTAI
jgi:uncharacterized membrane protein